MDSRISGTVEHIYDALLDDDALESLGGAFAKLLGATSGWFPIVNTQTGAARLVAPFNISSSAVAPYQAYYHQIDPWLAAGMAASRNRAFLSDDYITTSQFRDLQVFVDYVQPHFGNISRLLGAHIPIGDEIAFVGMHRMESLGAFPEESAYVLTRLIPALYRLLTVRKRLDAANARTADLEATVDAVGYGVVRCTGDCKIIYANRAALEILGRQDGLRGILGARLAALGTNDGSILNRFIYKAAQIQAPSSGALQIGRAGGQPPYRLVVIPFRVKEGAKNTALILIDDPEKQRPDLLQHIRDIYGFTVAEGQLAIGLMSGLSPEDYAEARAIRITTVRTQIRSMMGKAGTLRLIDLIAALVQIPSISQTP